MFQYSIKFFLFLCLISLSFSPMVASELIDLQGISILVPKGHRIADETAVGLHELKKGNFKNLRVYYVGPLNKKNGAQFRQLVEQLSEELATEISIIDPALKDDSLQWTLHDNLIAAKEILGTANSIVIAPIGDVTLFRPSDRPKESYGLKVSTLEIMTFLTHRVQVNPHNGSKSNYQNIIGGSPLGGRLMDPILINDQWYNVFIPTIGYDDVACINSKQDILDLWQITLGTRINPFENPYILEYLPSSYTMFFQRLLKLPQECKDQQHEELFARSSFQTTDGARPCPCGRPA